MKCNICKTKITPKEAEKYDNLCFKCATNEFNERIMKEALAYGYGYDEMGS